MSVQPPPHLNITTPVSMLARFAWGSVVFGLPLLTFLGLLRLWRPPTLLECSLAIALYVAGGLGISLGWHRYFTHRSFKCARPVAVLLAVAGSLTGEGSLASWVANHRVHHAHTDEPGDPHSPRLHGSRLRGFIHAHLGWLRLPGAATERHARDITRDRVLAFTSRWWWVWMLAGVVLPAALVLPLHGFSAAWGVLLWSGLLRIVLFHHVTWSVNSVCHLWGARPHNTSDHSGNVWWLALPSFGESWHNNHHAAPAAARHGSGRFQVDLSARLLTLLERVGLAWDVRWPNRP